MFRSVRSLKEEFRRSALGNESLSSTDGEAARFSEVSDNFKKKAAPVNCILMVQEITMKHYQYLVVYYLL